MQGFNHGGKITKPEELSSGIDLTQTNYTRKKSRYLKTKSSSCSFWRNQLRHHGWCGPLHGMFLRKISSKHYAANGNIKERRRRKGKGKKINETDNMLSFRPERQTGSALLKKQIFQKMMDLFYRYSLLFIMNAAWYFIDAHATSTCFSPQYLELGMTETVNCVFEEGYFGIYWYNTTDYTNNDPIIHYNGVKVIGDGYESGEFNVHPNGSLIINKVSLKHERVFIAAYIKTKHERPSITDVKLIVFVKPEVNFPQINVCGNTTNVCFLKQKLPIYCTVRDVRPNVTLNWIIRQLNEDKDLTEEMEITSGDVGYTTRAILTDVLQDFPTLVLLVCKAFSQPTLLKKTESFVLFQRKAVNLPQQTPKLRQVERNSEMLLSCTDEPLGLIVWQKINSLNQSISEVLLYAVFVGGDHFNESLVSDVSLITNGSLKMNSVDQKDEGTYVCIFGNGLTNGWITYDIRVIVRPNPGFPTIEGCDHQNYCVLEVKRTGTLTCKVAGISPQIQLQWRAFDDSNTDLIYFDNQQLIVKDNGETFDVSLTATYQVRDKSLDKLSIECKEKGSESPFHLSTKLDLFFTEDYNPVEEEDILFKFNNLIWILLVAVVTFVLILCGILSFKYIAKTNKKDVEIASNEEEMTKILPPKPHDTSTTLGDLKELFLKQIKGKYKDWYDSVQPIPYIKDRLYCVEKVFVEGGIVFLDSVEGVEGRGVWKTLESYEDVFKASQVSSTRRILEGEPGYGKSTVTLQFAYDWCNPKPTSFLKDVEIFILLRLRQLGGVPSIYKAIKRFILPIDSTISEADIENILRSSKSVVIILDGFDEYPDKDSATITDVLTIIGRNMFQDFNVVTTTRSSFLPKKYPPLTKRIRLSGFDDKARRYYIRKAVVGDNDDEGVRKIEGHLADNPVLSDLCQVPILFVLFAHMTHETEKFRNLNSVTSLFRHMISCFHSHMRNKMEDENVRKYELFEENHGDLDKLAFEAFSGKNQKIVWDKDEMCRLVGQEFYEQYVRIGILVEEESVDIIDDPGTLITEHVQYKTEVRFYHKLFCEWYAAYYLTEFLQKNPALDISDFLRNLDPFDVQYLYRFACGINPESAEKLIEHLQSIEGGDKFAILCILEQTGNIGNIEKTLRKLCDEGVVISGHDTLLLQRSSLQLLEIAAKNKITIIYVNLNDCSLSVEESGLSIKINSRLLLTSRLPVEKLGVTFYNKEMTEEDAIDILEFSSVCPSLRHLRFGGSVPPLVIWNQKILSALQSHGTKVFWRLKKGAAWYQLDLQDGRWKNEMTGKYANEDEFQHLRSKFRTEMLAGSEDFHKDEIREMRERLRREALKRNFKSDGGKEDKI